MPSKLSEKIKNGKRDRRKSLLLYLSPGDVLMFNENGEGEYFFIESIGLTKTFVSGRYYNSSGRVEEGRRMSLDRIADRNPKVAYLRDI